MKATPSVPHRAECGHAASARVPGVPSQRATIDIRMLEKLITRRRYAPGFGRNSKSKVSPGLICSLAARGVRFAPVTGIASFSSAEEHRVGQRVAEREVDTSAERHAKQRSRITRCLAFFAEH